MLYVTLHLILLNPIQMNAFAYLKKTFLSESIDTLFDLLMVSTKEVFEASHKENRSKAEESELMDKQKIVQLIQTTILEKTGK